MRVAMSRNHDRYGQHIYGAVHERERQRWVRRVRAGGVCCWRCGRLIVPGAAWDLGDVDEDGRAGGLPTRQGSARLCEAERRVTAT